MDLKNYSFTIMSIITLFTLLIIITFIGRSYMGGFQKLTLIIAIIILFVALIVIAFSLHNSKIVNWPPVVSNCPDYWLSDVSGNNITCINVKDLGTCKAKSGDLHLSMNFNNAPFTGSNGNCAKYTWANNCNIAWDGVNYGISNPCV